MNEAEQRYNRTFFLEKCLYLLYLVA